VTTLKPDTFTNTPEDAAAYERLRGQDTNQTEPGGFVETRTRYCSKCQSAPTSGYVCGPCTTDAKDCA
jgi:hypothetical protein